MDLTILVIIKKDTSLDKDQIVFLLRESEHRNCTCLLVAFSLQRLEEIGSYNSAGEVFENFIFTLIDHFDLENLKELLTIMNNENQIFRDFNRNLYIRKIEKIIKDFDLSFSDYPNLLL